MAEAETTNTETTSTETTATETKPGTETTTTEQTTTETKPDEATETKSAAETKGAETDAPADYTKLTMPDGYKTDDPVFADAVKLFGDKKIAPDVAQELIDFTVKRDKEIAKAVNDASATAWTKQTGEWKEASAKEFSAEALGDAKTALAQVFDKETVTYLESMGFTNHPGLIRGMVKVSQAIKDDTWVSGNAGQVNGSDARKAFPNSNMNP